MIRINKKMIHALANLLEDIEKQYDKSRLDPRANVQLIKDPQANIFIRSGVLTEDGKAIRVEEFLEKYGQNEYVFKEKVRLLVEASTANFVENRTETFYKNYIAMLEKMGIESAYLEWLKTLTPKQFYALYEIDPTMENALELYHEAVDYLLDYYFDEQTAKNPQMIKDATKIVSDRNKLREK